MQHPAWWYPGGGWVQPGGLARSFLERAGERTTLRADVQHASASDNGRWGWRLNAGYNRSDERVAFVPSAGTSKVRSEFTLYLAATVSGLSTLTCWPSIAGAVSIPTRHIHQTIESTNKKDLQAGILLLAACVCEIDSHNWKF